jgi:predicted NAD/FAD-dependent oxidoreductase
MDARPSVLIVGGGVAGLSSAVAHIEAGFRVCIIEKRKQLGGRAWSDKNGFDNGPHVILGCYGHFRKLLRALETEHLFEKQDTLKLTWLFPGGRILRLTPPRLPSPFHLLAGLFQLKLPLRKRLGLFKGSLAVRLPLPPQGTTLQTWFQMHKIKRDTQLLFFEPLCRAVMNVEVDQADARLFLETLRVAFGSSRQNGAIWSPKAPWSDILHCGAQSFIDRNQIELIQAHVTTIHLSSTGSIESVTLSNGNKKTAVDRVVLAVPWPEAARLAPFAAFSNDAKKIQPSSIVSVSFPPPKNHLHFPELLLTLKGGEPFHFLCRRPGPQSWLTLLAGVANQNSLNTKDDWILEGSKCLHSFLGDEVILPENHMDLAQLRREAKATIAATPAIANLRPPPGPTEVPGLWLAGDWTATGFPSTLEGAAKSGTIPPTSPPFI